MGLVGSDLTILVCCGSNRVESMSCWVGLDPVTTDACPIPRQNKSFYFSNVDPALLDSHRRLHSAYMYWRRITVPWGHRVSNILWSSVTAVTATFQQRLKTQLFASTPAAMCFDAIHLSFVFCFCTRDCVKQESLANAKVG